MNSFNVYGQTSETIGGNTPVWLGTVKPIPRGAKLPSATPGTLIPAGTLLVYNAEDGEAMVSEPSRENANAYLYNDVYIEEGIEGGATCAIVMHHPEGLLIERVYPEITEEQIQTLQTRIPGVLLVRG